MTAASVTLIGVAVREREPMPGFPPEIAAEIIAFLSSGKTGNVQIDVKRGKILGCRVSSYVRAGEMLDDKAQFGDHSDHE